MCFPDLLGCISVGDDLMHACEMAKEALELHVYGMEKDGEVLPEPSKELKPKDCEGCLVVPITIYPELLKKRLDNRKVKTNCTLPAWVKDLAEANNINYSQLLETSILNYLGGER